MNTKTQNKIIWLHYFNKMFVFYKKKCVKKMCGEKIRNCIDNIDTVDNSRRVN